MLFRVPLLLAAALCAIPRAPRADEPQKAPPPAEQGKPLSEEDAEVVKQLAQLEQLELLRNLELFDPKPGDGQIDQQQADAGTRSP
jgi:hypothetical protein